MENGYIIEACDLLFEIDHLDKVKEFADTHNIKRIYDYLLACSSFSTDTDEYLCTLRTAYEISLQTFEYPFALRAAIKLDDQKLIDEAFNSCEDPVV